MYMNAVIYFSLDIHIYNRLFVAVPPSSYHRGGQVCHVCNTSVFLTYFIIMLCYKKHSKHTYYGFTGALIMFFFLLFQSCFLWDCVFPDPIVRMVCSLFVEFSCQTTCKVERVFQSLSQLVIIFLSRREKVQSCLKCSLTVLSSLHLFTILSTKYFHPVHRMNTFFHILSFIYMWVFQLSA